MGNSKKINRPDLRLVPNIDEEPKKLLKTVPAKIHDEVVGIAYMYDDHSIEIEVNPDISEEGRLKLHDAGLFAPGLIVRKED